MRTARLARQQDSSMRPHWAGCWLNGGFGGLGAMTGCGREPPDRRCVAERPKPARGGFVVEWPVYFVSRRSQNSSRNAELRGSGHCPMTAAILEICSRTAALQNDDGARPQPDRQGALKRPLLHIRAATQIAGKMVIGGA